MNEKESPFSLFSSQGKKTPHKNKEPPPPAPPAQETPLDTQTREMFDKIKEMQQTIKNRLEYIENKSGMKKEDILKLIGKIPGSKLELEKLDADLKTFSEKVWKAVGEDASSKKTDLTEKQRKSKTLGSRRNWMRMG